MDLVLKEISKVQEQKAAITEEEWKSPYNPFNSMKALLWREHIEKILANEFLPPVSADIDPSNVCNLNCTWCISNKYIKENPLMVSEENLIKLARFLGKWRVKGVCVGGGGEPLTNPATPELLYELVKNNVEASLITNGVLFDEKSIAAVAETCRFCGFSVDAGEAESWALLKNTNRSTFFKIIENIAQLDKYRKKHDLGVTIGYKFLIHPGNYKGILEACRLAKKIGVDDFHMRPVHLEDPSVYTKDVINEARELISAAHSLSDEHFKVYGVLHKFSGDWRKRFYFKKCFANPLTLTFGADGNMHICCDRRGEEGMILGSWLNLDNVKKLWNSAYHKQLIAEIDIKDCPRCTFAPHNEIIEHVFLNDKMNMNFI